jgi:hypothetical protein
MRTCESMPRARWRKWLGDSSNGWIFKRVLDFASRFRSVSLDALSL